VAIGYQEAIWLIRLAAYSCEHLGKLRTKVQYGFLTRGVEVVMTSDVRTAFSGVDLVVMMAKVDRKPSDDRRAYLRNIVSISRQHAAAIDKYAKKTVKVVTARILMLHVGLLFIYDVRCLVTGNGWLISRFSVRHFVCESISDLFRQPSLCALDS